MTIDPFASGAASSLFAWLFAVPIIVSIVAGSVGMLFERTDDSVPRWFLVWMILCVLALSPFRYMVLQVVIASSYSVQSVGALVTLIPLMLYVPIVFGILYVVGLVVPVLLTVRIAFHDLKQPVVTRRRLALGAVAAPLNMVGGYIAFFWLLSYAGMAVHWLPAAHVIGATNGPALFLYEHVLANFTPLPIGGHYVGVTESDRDMLRNHVATFYLGPAQEAVYVRSAYPDLYQHLTGAVGE